MSKGLIAVIVAIAVIAAVGGIASFMSRDKPAAARPNVANPQAGRAQPGPAPPGKVWSAEHGHWHDAAQGTGGQQRIPVNMPPQQQTTTTPTTPVPQPAGTPPPGKVWSPEHGHWHDAPK